MTSDFTNDSSKVGGGSKGSTGALHSLFDNNGFTYILGQGIQPGVGTTVRRVLFIQPRRVSPMGDVTAPQEHADDAGGCPMDPCTRRKWGLPSNEAGPWLRLFLSVCCLAFLLKNALA